MLPLVDGLLRAFAGAASLLKPVVDEHFAQKSDNEYTERIKRWQELVNQTDSPERAGGIESFLDQLLIDAGTPVRRFQVGDQLVRIPVQYLNALIQNTAENIRDTRKLAAIQFKMPSQ